MLLINAVLHADGVVGGGLRQTVEDAVAATNHRLGIWIPVEAYAWLELGFVDVNGRRIEGRQVARGVRLGRLRKELNVIAQTGRHLELGADLVALVDESTNDLLPGIIFADAGDGVVHLGEAGVVLTAIDAVDVLHPVGEGAGCRAGRVAVNAAALEEVDGKFVNKVQIHASLQRALAKGLRIGVACLPAMLVGEAGTRQRVGHTVGRHAAYRDRGTGRVGRGRLQIA